MNAVMWERDYQGMRYAAGMLNGWAMQSLASVSGISGGRCTASPWGTANSRKRDNTLSLTPIVVYFPTAGEARIRRDGQLIGIQRFDVGNHEIDTSALPLRDLQRGSRGGQRQPHRVTEHVHREQTFH